jgi:hypothetical protein
VRICEDLWQVESFKNWLDSWSMIQNKYFKSGFVIHDTNQIWICFLRPQIGPLWIPVLWPWYHTNRWICETNPRVHDSLIRFLQPYKFQLFLELGISSESGLLDLQTQLSAKTVKNLFQDDCSRGRRWCRFRWWNQGLSKVTCALQ